LGIGLRRVGEPEVGGQSLRVERIRRSDAVVKVDILPQPVVGRHLVVADDNRDGPVSPESLAFLPASGICAAKC
jgi:hypothetical protein